MKRLLAFILLFVQFFSSAQDLKNDLYYYKGEQIPIDVNYNAFFVVSNSQLSLAPIFQQYGYNFDSVYGGTHGDPLDSLMYWQVVKINNATLNLATYNTLRTNLKNNDHLTIEPVLGTSELRPFSHYFYVRLETVEDTVALDSVSTAMGTTIVDCLSDEFLWYKLKASASSTGNSLEMSNYFYETGLFRDIDPGFIYFFETAACTTTTTDPDYNQQWALEYTTNPAYDINACQAWSISKGSSSIKVAIVDAGLQVDTWPIAHPEYGNNLSISTNTYDAKTDKSPSWYYYPHGIPSAGIIAANHNGSKMMGIAPNTTLMDISHPIDWNAPSLTGGDEMAKGFDWARQHGADIINNSWGDVGNNIVNTAVLETSIEAAITSGRGGKGCSVVFASHNSDNPKVPYPAKKFPKVICVGNMAKNGERYDPPAGSGSNYGPDLDVMAPGAEIYSTNGINQTNQAEMTTVYGTSYAAPHVSGVAALMLAENSCLNEEDVRTIIEATAQKVNTTKYQYTQWSNRYNGLWNYEMGYGLLDAHAAVKLAKDAKKSTKDLYIKDRPYDMGIEPNTDNTMWLSDDIWIRNQDDGKLEHQNPDYYADPNNHYVWVYVRVRNKGCTASSGNERLVLHWAKGNSGAGWSSPWNGLNQPPTPNGGVIPNYLTSTQYTSVPAMQSGNEKIIKFRWTLPNPLNYPNPFPASLSLGYFHYCLLARVTDPVDSIDDIGTESGVLFNNVKNKNNIAQKNVDIIDFSGSDGAAGMMADHSIVEVGNYSPGSSLTADLEFTVAPDEEGNPITQESEVRVILDDDIWDVWQNSGAESEGFSVEDATKHILLATDSYAKLSGLQFSADLRGKVAVKVNFLTEETSTKEHFNYDLIQRNSSDNSIIGGNRFVIIKPERTEGEMFVASGQYNSSSPSTIELNATAISEPAGYKWYTIDTTLVDTGVTANVSPAQNTTYLLEVTADADGYKDYAEVNVPAVSQNYIVSLSPNPATTSVTASYHLDSSVQSATLTVVAANNPTQTLLNQALNIQQTQVTLNTSGLQPGVYIVNLICGGNIQDGEQLVIQ